MVENIDEDIQKLVDRMASTMYAAPGIGLAANQVGTLKRILVYDLSPQDKNRNLSVLINPEIVEMEGEVIDVKGCLSVIEFSAKVKRARWIKVRAMDIKGKPLHFEVEDWDARVIQHEVDHLLGILYIDHISALKRSLYKKKLKKLLKEQEG